MAKTRCLRLLALAVCLVAAPLPVRGQPRALDAPAPALPDRAAVAPPLGDMAVESMTLGNRRFVTIPGGQPVTLTVRDARASDVLMALARTGGYNFALVDDPVGDAAGNDAAQATAGTANGHRRSAERIAGGRGEHGAAEFRPPGPPAEQHAHGGPGSGGPYVGAAAVEGDSLEPGGCVQVPPASLANLGATMSVTESVTTRAVEDPAAAAASPGTATPGPGPTVSTTAVTPPGGDLRRLPRTPQGAAGHHGRAAQHHHPGGIGRPRGPGRTLPAENGSVANGK